MKTIKIKWKNISKISCAVFLFCIFALVCIVFFAKAEEMDLSGVLGTMFVIVLLISGLLTVLFLLIQFVLEMRAEYFADCFQGISLLEAIIYATLSKS